jgi:hypothetical protein
VVVATCVCTVHFVARDCMMRAAVGSTCRRGGGRTAVGRTRPEAEHVRGRLLLLT